MGNLDCFKILAILGSIFTFIFAFFDREHKKSLNLKEEYFKNVLVKYINKYRKNKNINAIRFLKSKFGEDTYFIPPYVLYLIDQKNKEDLHKVLIEDYKENFPNSQNSIWKTISRVDKIFDLLLILSLGILFGAITTLIINFLLVLIIQLFDYSHLKEFIFNDGLKYLIQITVSLLILIGFIIVSRNSLRNDEYSSNKKIIIKLINKKKKYYDKSKDSNYFI
ncbi:hypothetical protein [Clostridium perfringens]|uniref:hypothetical protein n=1 Tax=Clostridium perfringens TaxID=1502 RepID=UPI00111E2234|nr:hypothetical protein [Clostridium perfringens]TPE20646.1 hypothetical protein FJM09_04290 [Clostridium perfringens]